MESVLWGSAHGPTVGGWEIAARYSWAVEPSSCSRPGHEAGAGVPVSPQSMRELLPCSSGSGS